MIISKDFHFEAAHMLSSYKGPCANLHGHSYTGTVYIDGDASKTTYMVLDFNEVKKFIDKYDHATIFSSSRVRGETEEALYTLVTGANMKYVVINSGKCTAEDIAYQIAREILFEGNRSYKVRVCLKETASSLVDTGWVE